MHNNFYFLRQLSLRLREKLLDWEIVTCFSQQKNELILGLAKSAREFYIRAFLQPDFCCLSFPDQFHRSKRNTVELFTEILGLKVNAVHQFENERSFSIVLENSYQILFKMHGNRANVLLFHEGSLSKLFRSNLKKDREIQLQQLDRPIEHSFENFKNHQFNHKAVFPTFGKLVCQQLETDGVFSLPPEDQWRHLMQMHHDLLNPSFYVTEVENKWTLSLIDMGLTKTQYSDPIAAINTFFSTFIKDYSIHKEKSVLLGQLQSAKSRAGNYVIKTQNQLAKISTGLRHEEKANIIMANLHNIPARAEEVELFDFYENKPIKIKLKKDLNPAKNAEVYYRKAKNQKIEIGQLKKNLEQKEKELSEISHHIEQISEIDDVKALRKYINQNISNTQQDKRIDLPFRRFLVDGFEVLVGKNAKSNDELTKKYAKKDDLWLHAKDVAGSHVVLKSIPGRPFPNLVIEKAAQIAAFYSKRKSDTLCPVIFTQKKYVFKPKGASSGKVAIDREEVMLVEPQKPTY